MRRGRAGRADRIVLGPGLYRRTLGGSGEQGNALGDLDVAGTSRSPAPAPRLTIIDAAGLDRVIDVLPGRTLRIADVTITGGATPGGPSAAPRPRRPERAA